MKNHPGFTPDKIKIVTDQTGKQSAYRASEEAEKLLKKNENDPETTALLDIYKLLYSNRDYSLDYENEETEPLKDGLYDMSLFKEIFIAADILAPGEPFVPKKGNGMFSYIGDEKKRSL